MSVCRRYKYEREKARKKCQLLRDFVLTRTFGT